MGKAEDKPKTVDITVSMDAWRYTLNLLRAPCGKKASGSIIARGAEVEEDLDDFLEQNPRPRPEDLSDFQCPKCGTEFAPITGEDGEDFRLSVRKWLRTKHKRNYTKRQEDAIKFRVEEARKAGQLPMTRAIGEILSELGLDTEE